MQSVTNKAIVETSRRRAANYFYISSSIKKGLASRQSPMLIIYLIALIFPATIIRHPHNLRCKLSNHINKLLL